MSNAEISQKTAELKLLMHEKNAVAIQKRLEAYDPTKPKEKKKREPIWARSSGHQKTRQKTQLLTSNDEQVKSGS